MNAQASTITFTAAEEAPRVLSVKLSRMYAVRLWADGFKEQPLLDTTLLAASGADAIGKALGMIGKSVRNVRGIAGTATVIEAAPPGEASNFNEQSSPDAGRGRASEH